MTTFNWVHLSDWHQRGNEFDRKVVLDKLQDDLKDRAAIDGALGAINLVIFSGDLAFSGLAAEYEAARVNLLEPVRTSLGLEARDFFFIPGNHDLDRNQMREMAPPTLQKPLAEAVAKDWLTDVPKLNRVLEPFAAFGRFAAGYSAQADASFASRRELVVDGRRVALLGLNSALMCGRRLDAKGEVDDRAVLTVGEPQFHDGLRGMEGADLRICVVHHPAEWLHEYDRIRLEPALRGGADVVLTGHVHRPGIEVSKHPRGSMVMVPAGSSYDRREADGVAYANAYNFVSLDLATGKGVVHLRRWDGQNSCWTEDTATSPRGRFGFTLPRLKSRPGAGAGRAKGATAEMQEASALASYRLLLMKSCDLMETANLPSDHLVAQRELTLRHLFIPTRVRVEPAGADDAAGADGDAGFGAGAKNGPGSWRHRGDETVVQVAEAGPRVAPGACLRTNHRLVLLGNPGAGKTTFTRWLAMACALRQQKDPAADVLADIASLPAWALEPVLIRCRDLEPGAETGGLPLLLQQCYRAGELPEAQRARLGEALARAVREGRAVLILDGLDEIADARRRSALCQRILQVGRDHEHLPIVATSRIVGYRETGDALRRGFAHATVDELLPEEKDRFATGWCALTEPPERQTRAAAELIADIHGNPRIERLTGTPIMLTTMALVRRSIGHLPQRRVELFPKAIEVLLKWRSDVDQPLDSWEVLPQLAYLAYAMCLRGVARLDEGSVLALLEAMREEFPHLVDIQGRSPRAFLQVVEARTALLIQSGHERLAGELIPVYEFRHLSFQEYLAAWAMVRGYEPGFRKGRPLAVLVGRLAEREASGAPSPVGLEGSATSTLTEVIRLCIADCSHEDTDACLRAVLGEDAGVGRLRRARVQLATLCLADEPRDVQPGTAATILRRSAEDVDFDPHFGAGGAAWKALATSRWRSEGLAALLAASGLRDSPFPAHTAALVFQTAYRDDIAGAAARALNGQDEGVAFGALATVGPEAGSKQTPENGELPTQIQAWLDRPARTLRRAAAEALGRIGAIEAVPTLVRRLGEDDDEGVRWAAAEALGRIGAIEAVPTLVRHLGEDDDRSVRFAAAEALGRIGAMDAVPALVGRLGEDDDRSVRFAAAEALGRIGAMDAVPALVGRLGEDDDSSVRFAAAEALGRIGAMDAVPALVGRLGEDDDSSVRSAAAEALGRIGAMDAVPALVGRLGEDDDSSVRSAAAEALGRIGAMDAVPALVGRLGEDDDSSVRSAAAEALGRIGRGGARADRGHGRGAGAGRAPGRG